MAELFAQAAAERFGLDALSLSPELLGALKARGYPGNVRELENLMTRLVALCEGTTLDAPLLRSLEGGSSSAPEVASRAAGAGTFREQVERLERTLLKDALERAGGNQSEAARSLDLSRVTFLDKLKRHGL